MTKRHVRAQLVRNHVALDFTVRDRGEMKQDDKIGVLAHLRCGGPAQHVQVALRLPVADAVRTFLALRDVLRRAQRAGVLNAGALADGERAEHIDA